MCGVLISIFGSGGEEWWYQRKSSWLIWHGCHFEDRAVLILYQATCSFNVLYLHT